MQQTKIVIRILVNLLGGIAVISNDVYGSLTYPNASQVLWGSWTVDISALLQCVTQVIVPPAGSFLLGRLVDIAPEVASVALMLWAAYFAYRLVIRAKSPVVTPVRQVANA